MYNFIAVVLQGYIFLQICSIKSVKYQFHYLPTNSNHYRKTEQITANHNSLQKQKLDTFCILTVKG